MSTVTDAVFNINLIKLVDRHNGIRAIFKWVENTQ